MGVSKKTVISIVKEAVESHPRYDDFLRSDGTWKVEESHDTLGYHVDLVMGDEGPIMSSYFYKCTLNEQPSKDHVINFVAGRVSNFMDNDAMYRMSSPNPDPYEALPRNGNPVEFKNTVEYEYDSHLAQPTEYYWKKEMADQVSTDLKRGLEMKVAMLEEEMHQNKMATSRNLDAIMTSRAESVKSITEKSDEIMDTIYTHTTVLIAVMVITTMIMSGIMLYFFLRP